MCGIGGYYGFKSDGLIAQMSKDMEHRGPDGEGIYSDETVTLLNRRLAIIDVQGGNQPIYNEDKSLVVVYNGEIYNYRELRSELEKKGHTFTTNSDTEVIVHGYEEWGDEAFDRYNGMFGIALYDIPRKRLILARDHFGIKPLYYALTSDSKNEEQNIIFASELKPLIHSGKIQKKVNENVLYRYLAYRIHDEGRETFFHGIERLLPGEMMIVENGKIQQKMYTSLEKNLRSETSKYKTEFREVQSMGECKGSLFEVVQRRLISEVPVGTCLSGGLDSSAVVAISNFLLREHVSDAQSLGEQQKTFSAVFPKSTNDEERYVDDLIAKLKRVESIKVTPKPETFFQDIQDFIRTQEEPTISTGPYAQYCVMKEASKYVKVLLDGQGADEMMAGYYPYYFVYWKQLMKEGNYGKFVQELWTSRDVLSRFIPQKIAETFKLKKRIPLQEVLNTDFYTKNKNETFSVRTDNLKQRLIDDIFRNSLQSLLRYEDKNAMRFSIEGRVPFLDFEFVQFIMSLPDEAIIKEGWNKYILRLATKDLLPDSINKRRNKIGFTTPEHEWFMRMKNRIYGIFLSEKFQNRPYFNQKEILKAFEDFIQGKNDDTLFFWRVLNTELWLREFFDQPGEKKNSTKEKGYFEPNTEKSISLTVDDKEYIRIPVKTGLFAKGDDYAEKIAGEVKTFFTTLSSTDSTIASQIKKKKKWFVIISEKVVAISQGRSYFIWDITPSWWAATLSTFVTRTPYGIGLGSPWTMQLAINEVGLFRILFAAVASVLTKPFGKKGTFYEMAGREVAAIDGPTEYSLYPSNVSAKLGPKKPQDAAKKIKKEIEQVLEKTQHNQFEGVVVIDANDLGRNVLGNATKYSDNLVEQIMRDNPMGQGSEQTPLVFVWH